MRQQLQDSYMKTISGSKNTAVVYTTSNRDTMIDSYAVSQIENLCSLDVLKNSRIRIMPDVHAGKVCPIGFTATLGNGVMPVLVGIDIGCGISIMRITKGRPDWNRLDSVIRDHIPSGSSIRQKISVFAGEFGFTELQCSRHIRKLKAELSLGTLGGGNHFIEVNECDGEMFLTVHSGSRHLGKEVFEHYMSAGQKFLRQQGINIPYELTWIEGDLMKNYLNDISVTQNFARLNREIILNEIKKGMKWKGEILVSCSHNYIDFDPVITATLGSPLIRKGAISAKNGETVAIPVNMRDGIIIAEGLGNREWNFSAPHGSGRILKRTEVKNHITLSSFKKQMNGIYTRCISSDTLDEAPDAYRGIKEIAEAIGETVKIAKILRPVYSYKAGTEN